MILAGGRILDTDRQEELLDTLEDRINRTREQGELSPQTVIEAADRLGTLIAEGAFGQLPGGLEAGRSGTL